MHPWYVRCMSSLLAAIARSLATHWERGLAGLVLTIVVVGAVIGSQSGSAPQDFSIPGTESQKAHRPARGEVPAGGRRASSQVVFTTRLRASCSDPAQKAQVGEVDRRRCRSCPTSAASTPIRSAEGGAVSKDGRTAFTTVQYDSQSVDMETDDGKALEKAARAAEGDGVSVADARRGRRPRGAAGRAGRRARRRRHRVRPAHAPVPLARGDVRDARRRARGRRPEPDDPAGGEGPDRDPGLRDHHRGDARPGCRHRLRVAHLQSLQRAVGRRRRPRRRRRRARTRRRAPPSSPRASSSWSRSPACSRWASRSSARWASARPSRSPPSSSPRSPCCRSSPARWRSGCSRRTPRTSRAPSASTRWGRRIVRRPAVPIAIGGLVLIILAIPFTSMRLGQPDDGNKPTDDDPAPAYDELVDGVRPRLQRPAAARDRQPGRRRARHGEARRRSARPREGAGRRGGRAREPQRGRRRGDHHA